MRREARLVAQEPSPVLRFWHELGCQLRHPSGGKGRWVGHLMSVINRQPNRLALGALQVSMTDNVLELGVGSGWALRRLARLACRGQVWGIDQSSEMLRLASRHVHSSAGRAAVAKARFESLPFPTESFDRLLAVNVAYFFDRDGRDLREAYRVLRPGGRMAIYVSDRKTLAKWPFAGEDTHRAYDADELLAAVVGAGFAPNGVAIVTVKLPLAVSGLLATAVKQ